MPAIATALDTPFKPAVGTFVVSVKNGPVSFWMRNADDAEWVPLKELGSGGYHVDNPVDGVGYKFTQAGEGDAPYVRADQ